MLETFLTPLVNEGLKTTRSNRLKFRLLCSHKKTNNALFFIALLFFSGGGLLICERILNEDKRGPLPSLIFSLLMLVSTGGKERSAPEFKHLLEKHGFIDVQAKRVYFTQDAIFCRKM